VTVVQPSPETREQPEHPGYELAFQEGLRAIAQQQAVLDPVEKVVTTRQHRSVRMLPLCGAGRASAIRQGYRLSANLSASLPISGSRKCFPRQTCTSSKSRPPK
jgi:hypothetical protein